MGSSQHEAKLDWYIKVQDVLLHKHLNVRLLKRESHPELVAYDGSFESLEIEMEQFIKCRF